MRSPAALLHHVLLPPEQEHVVPRWLPLGFLAAAAFLLPWSAFLLLTLPREEQANHWALAWTGFDIGVFVALLCTALFSLRRSVLTAFWATMTGTITLVDAWFDILTARGHVAQVNAILLAAVAEIPLAVVSFWWAHGILKAVDRAVPQLQAEGWRLQHGVLVPPAAPRSDSRSSAALP
jgi:hypothetical protein